MVSVVAKQPKRSELAAVVIRLCRCQGEPVLDQKTGRLVSSCGHPSITQDLGVIAFYHRNPFVRLWYRLVKGVRGRVHPHVRS